MVASTIIRGKIEVLGVSHLSQEVRKWYLVALQCHLEVR